MSLQSFAEIKKAEEVQDEGNVGRIFSMNAPNKFVQTVAILAVLCSIHS